MTGAYFVKRKAAQPSAAARDDAAAKRLWKASEALDPANAAAAGVGQARAAPTETDRRAAACLAYPALVRGYPVTLRMVQKSLARFGLIRYSYGIMKYPARPQPVPQELRTMNCRVELL